MQCRPVGINLAARGKSHGFSGVAAGTWGIFSCCDGVDTSKPVFVQRHQESCLVMRTTARISLRLRRAMKTVTVMSREIQGTFLVAKVILGFLTIFNKSQASSPFEALTPRASLGVKGM